jgi:hypothetical protein
MQSAMDAGFSVDRSTFADVSRKGHLIIRNSLLLRARGMIGN